MKTTINRGAILGALLAVAGLLAPASTATAQERNLVKAKLISLNQVPAVLTQSAGLFEAEINDDNTISWAMTYTGIASPVMMAHIHFGASKTNGGVMVFLCGGPKPACPATGTVTGVITAADVSTLPATNGDSVIPQGIQLNDLNALITAIRTGNSYVNVHTKNFPNGELRGQLAIW